MSCFTNTVVVVVLLGLAEKKVSLKIKIPGQLKRFQVVFRYFVT